MPSPLGHSILGLAIGLGYVLPRCRPSELLARIWNARWLLALAVVLANLPDIDYIPGILVGYINAYHHGYTHTLGWVLLVGAGVWAIWRYLKPRVGAGELCFIFLALASHLVADIFSDDGLAPYGIMALWPFSDAHIDSPVSLFWQLKKRYLHEVFDGHNFRAAGVELMWTSLPILLVLWWKCRPGRPGRYDKLQDEDPILV